MVGCFLRCCPYSVNSEPNYSADSLSTTVCG